MTIEQTGELILIGQFDQLRFKPLTFINLTPGREEHLITLVDALTNLNLDPEGFSIYPLVYPLKREFTLSYNLFGDGTRSFI